MTNKQILEDAISAGASPLFSKDEPRWTLCGNEAIIKFAEITKAGADISNKSRFDCAYKVLNQIATMPRKTREQRLANACVLFLESLERQPIPLPPNAQQEMN